MRHRRNPIPEHLQYPRSGFLDEFEDTPPTRQYLAEQDRNCDNETYENLDLRHINFYEASLVNTKFINCDLRECRFLNVNCQNTIFKECDLRSSQFQQTLLNGSKFELSNLQRASFLFSTIPNLDTFDRANIEDTKFTDVALFFAYLQYKKGELSHLNIIGEPMFDALSLKDIDLQGANLERVQISRSNFGRANLKGANLSDGDFYGSNFERANLQGANLSGAILSDADLRYANLSGANLFQSDLRHTDLRFTNLIGANLDGARLIGAIWDHTTKT